MSDDHVRGPFTLDIELIVRSLAERTRLKLDDRTQLVDHSKTLEIHFTCRVYDILTSATDTRITVILPRYMLSYPQYAEFLFPPTDKRFEDELRRLESDDKQFELAFYRGRSDDNEIIYTRVYGDPPFVFS